MTLYDNASKLRCRKRAYMKHSEWKWFTPLVDHYAELMPKYDSITYFLTVLHLYNLYKSQRSIDPINGPN